MGDVPLDLEGIFANLAGERAAIDVGGMFRAFDDTTSPAIDVPVFPAAFKGIRGRLTTTTLGITMPSAAYRGKPTEEEVRRVTGNEMDVLRAIAVVDSSRAGDPRQPSPVDYIVPEVWRRIRLAMADYTTGRPNTDVIRHWSALIEEPQRGRTIDSVVRERQAPFVDARQASPLAAWLLMTPFATPPGGVGQGRSAPASAADVLAWTTTWLTTVAGMTTGVDRLYYGLGRTAGFDTRYAVPTVITGIDRNTVGSAQFTDGAEAGRTWTLTGWLPLISDMVRAANRGVIRAAADGSVVPRPAPQGTAVPPPAAVPAIVPPAAVPAAAGIAAPAAGPLGESGAAIAASAAAARGPFGWRTAGWDIGNTRKEAAARRGPEDMRQWFAQVTAVREQCMAGIDSLPSALPVWWQFPAGLIDVTVVSGSTPQPLGFEEGNPLLLLFSHPDAAAFAALSAAQTGTEDARAYAGSALAASVALRPRNRTWEAFLSTGQDTATLPPVVIVLGLLCAQLDRSPGTTISTALTAITPVATSILAVPPSHEDVMDEISSWAEAVVSRTPAGQLPMYADILNEMTGGTTLYSTAQFTAAVLIRAWQGACVGAVADWSRTVLRFAIDRSKAWAAEHRNKERVMRQIAEDGGHYTLLRADIKPEVFGDIRAAELRIDELRPAGTRGPSTFDRLYATPRRRAMLGAFIGHLRNVRAAQAHAIQTSRTAHRYAVGVYAAARIGLAREIGYMPIRKSYSELLLGDNP
jgi:hypothetical protein